MVSGVGLALVTVVSRELAEDSEPWITLGPIAVLTVYLLMRLNFERFHDRDEKARSAA
jgi:hypothetical protein